MSIAKRRPIPVQNRPGTPPGHYAKDNRPEITFSTQTFDYDALTLRASAEVGAATAPIQPHEYRWVHVQGTAPTSFLDALKDQYNIDDLLLEDIVNRERRPKMTEISADLLLILLIPISNKFAQMSVYTSGNLVLSFCDYPLPEFERIQNRLKQSGQLRNGNSMTLVYTLLDLCVDSFFVQLEAAGDTLEMLETDLNENPTRDVLHATHDIRALMMVTRKHAWATRDLVAQFQRYHRDTEQKVPERLLQDCYDHIVAVVDLSETYREIATALIEVHLSVASHHLNETIRILTIFTVLFVPATFIVGVYGMNFDRTHPLNMPELGSPYGYLGVLALIAVSMIAMIAYFKRNKWF
ncbi:MAG: magnesium/cobalt transporter CorA [bacterium]